MTPTSDHDTTRLLERLAQTFPDRPAPLPELVAAAHAGRRRRTRRNVALAGVACVLAVGAGAALQVLPVGGAQRTDRVADTPPPCDKQTSVAPREPVPRGPDYPTNAVGQTYGAAARDGGRDPDLVAAVGDCGRTGYIDPADLDPPPWVPGAGTPRSTPVYEADGTTQVDTFTQSPGATGTDGVTDPTAPTGPDADAVQGGWSAIIAGVTSGGKEQYDTFRDLVLTITFDGDQVRVLDGCRSWTAGFTLADGAFALTTSWTPDPAPDCGRAAPLPEVLDNVRHATRSGGRTYLSLANGQIVVVLTRT